MTNWNDLLECLRTVAAVVIVISVAGVWLALVVLTVAIFLTIYGGRIVGWTKGLAHKSRRGIPPSE